MVSHARRFTVFALVASLSALSAAAPASAQDPMGPDGDYDQDGVVNYKDKCPDEPHPNGVDASGCALPPDSDGDGYSDTDDACPDKAPDEYSDSRSGQGCPGVAPFSEPDTPVASGPSCSKKQPCAVLQRTGLSEMKDGGYGDPDATVKVTIARDAQGDPARIVGVQLRNVDSSCLHYDEMTRRYSSTPGPEVSADLEALALTKKRQRHANFFSTAYTFDPFAPIRTINGHKYRLRFYMEEDDELSEAEFSVDPAGGSDGDCSITVNGGNDPVTDGACKRKGSGSETGACRVVDVQYLDDVYKLGQALYFDCGVSFKCPAAKNVDVKLTVIKSVAKALGMKSTTISDKAVGPKRTKVDGERGTYYFIALRDDVARKMKAKQVREITVTVSGTATSPGGVRRFGPERVEWHTDGNCSGRDLKMKRHLVYGGKCS